MAIRGPLCAIQAGCCAALASVSAKIATSFDAATAISLSLMEIIHTICGLDLVPYAEKSTICIRLLGVAGIFVFNALMWVLFTKSMHLCSSTLEATAFNTSANFISTAIVGRLLFAEQLSMQWCLGSTLIVLGLVVLHKGSSQTADDLSVSEDSHIQGKTDSFAKLKKA